MDDLISREAAVSSVSDLLMNDLKGKRLPTWNEVYHAIGNIPSVPAVPLEPLAKWIAENLDPRCGCSYCSKERVCCDCPMMTEQQVKEELTKWMEEQDADRQ